MMKLILLLGVGSGQPAPLGLHFWLRVLEAGSAFVVGLALLNWFIERLAGRARRTGGGGGFRRRPAVPPRSRALRGASPSGSRERSAEAKAGTSVRFVERPRRDPHRLEPGPSREERHPPRQF